MSQNPPDLRSIVLDFRIYRVHTGKAAEFHALVRNETVPLARRFGHTVIDFGPSIEDSDIYYLVRSFATREDREVSLERLYGNAEWIDGYDARVSELLISYETVVFETKADPVAAWLSSTDS